jgi:type I restriction enzyme S subunit
MPIPPLAEQRRIVAKVDQLMAMVDQLEAQLAEARTRSTALLDAVIHELLNPSAEIVDLAAYRAAIGCYAIRKMASKPYFGRTAAMKLLYLAQAHVGLELDLRPVRDAAGPLDQWIYDFERKGAREDWFKVSTSTIANGKTKIAYQPGRMLAAQCAQAERLLSAGQRKEYERVLDLFADRTTEEAEIIATLFAAWNDFLIDGHSPDDDRIVTEVREHWHEKKGRFAPTLLRQWLAWLRQNNLIPTGRLPHTVHQPQLLH